MVADRFIIYIPQEKEIGPVRDKRTKIKGARRPMLMTVCVFES